MATIEREYDVHERALPERPVFVAADGRRARRLRIGAGLVAVLALLWLVALAAGTFGFGRLPGIAAPLDRIVGSGDVKGERSKPATAIPVRSDRRSGAVVIDSEQHAATRATAAAQGSASANAARARSNAPPARRRAAPPPAAVQPPALPVAPPPAQGWARHGLPAPPGYTRRTEQQLAPPPGQVVAPGQAKKALAPPPPPPPPPPGNGNGGGSKIR